MSSSDTNDIDSNDCARDDTAVFCNTPVDKHCGLSGSGALICSMKYKTEVAEKTSRYLANYNYLITHSTNKG